MSFSLEDGQTLDKVLLESGEEDNNASKSRFNCKDLRAFCAFKAWRLAWLMAEYLVILLTDVAGSHRGAVALLFSFTTMEVFYALLSILEYVDKREWPRDARVFACTAHNLAPAYGVLFGLPVALYESGSATGIDGMEPIVCQGIITLYIVTGAVAIAFGSRANARQQTQWREAIRTARASRLISQEEERKMLGFHADSDLTSSVGLTERTIWLVLGRTLLISILIALTPCFVRVNQGQPCGGDTSQSRFIVAWTSLWAGVAFSMGSFGALLLTTSVGHFQFVAGTVLAAASGDAVNSAEGLLQLHAFLVHFHRWMAATVRGLAVPFVCFSLCAAVLTVLLSLCYLVPAFLPFLFAHWPVLLMVAIFVGLLDLFVLAFLYRAATVNDTLTQAIEKLDSTLIKQARYRPAASAAGGAEAKGLSDAAASGRLVPALALRDAHELAALGLVLTHWTARKKGVTLAGVHLHSGLAQSALLALALQGLAFLVKVASDYGK